MYYTVYKITNIINNKYYIGMHKTNNLNDGYMGSGNLIKLAINKYGIENFNKEYIAIYDNENEMRLHEKELVNEDFINNSNTYNINIGGKGGFYYINRSVKTHDHEYNHSEKHRQHLIKISHEFNKRFKEDLEYREKILIIKKACQQNVEHKSFLGKKHTQESRKKISLVRKGTLLGVENGSYGTVWVYNENILLNKKITKEDLINHLNNGWVKGRRMEYYNK